jgi:hypothetical protein
MVVLFARSRQRVPCSRAGGQSSLTRWRTAGSARSKGQAMLDLASDYGVPRAEQADRRCSSSPEEVQGGRAPLPTPPSTGRASPSPTNWKAPSNSGRLVGRSGRRNHWRAPSNSGRLVGRSGRPRCLLLPGVRKKLRLGELTHLRRAGGEGGARRRRGKGSGRGSLLPGGSCHGQGERRFWETSDDEACARIGFVFYRSVSVPTGAYLFPTGTCNFGMCDEECGVSHARHLDESLKY